MQLRVRHEIHSAGNMSPDNVPDSVKDIKKQGRSVEHAGSSVLRGIA